jgi:hypothetical protein
MAFRTNTQESIWPLQVGLMESQRHLTIRAVHFVTGFERVWSECENLQGSLFHGRDLGSVIEEYAGECILPD